MQKTSSKSFFFFKCHQHRENKNVNIYFAPFKLSALCIILSVVNSVVVIQIIHPFSKKHMQSLSNKNSLICRIARVFLAQHFILFQTDAQHCPLHSYSDVVLMLQCCIFIIRCCKKKFSLSERRFRRRGQLVKIYGKFYDMKIKIFKKIFES